jgi:hypothetical protein
MIQDEIFMAMKIHVMVFRVITLCSGGSNMML